VQAGAPGDGGDAAPAQGVATIDREQQLAAARQRIDALKALLACLQS
jgi:hypothetical protein